MINKILFSTIFIVYLSLINYVYASEQIDFDNYQTGYINDIYYQKFGNNDQSPIIVLHGGPGLNQDYLLPQMLELAKNHTIVFYDQRGSGKSLIALDNINEKNINIKQFLQDIEAIRKYFKFKKVNIIGHSWGGYLGVQYALNYSKNINNLILLNSGSINKAGHDLFIKNFQARTKNILPKIEKYFDYEEFKNLNSKQIADFYRTVFSVYFYKSELLNKLNLSFDYNGAQSGFLVNQILFSKFNQEFNLSADLAKLDTRALIIHGKQDLIPVSVAETINSAIKNSKLVVLDECGHFCYIEQYNKVFEEIEKFLDN